MITISNESLQIVDILKKEMKIEKIFKKNLEHCERIFDEIISLIFRYFNSTCYVPFS